MYIAHTIAELREHLSAFERPAFVPTMGNLHAGHIALVTQAKPLGDATVASIFVNRLQFQPHEDFNTYPRTWESDCAKLRDAGCDVLFAPDGQALYPEPQTCKVHPDAALADILERDLAAIEARAMQALAARGWQPDYLVLRRRADLLPPSPGEPLVALTAARLGNTRLIDNLEIEVPAP